MKRILFIAGTMAIATIALPQLTIGQQASTETVTRVGEEIKYLAADELEGRFPGTEGIEIAANFILDEFKGAGLKSGTSDGSYMQPFDVDMGTNLDKAASHVVLKGPNQNEIKLAIGEQAQPLMVGGSGEVSGADLVFVGYGIDAEDHNYFDYKNIDVEGKIVVMLRMEPQQKNSESVFDGAENSDHASITSKRTLAREKNAAAILLVNDSETAPDADSDELEATNRFGEARQRIPLVQVKRAVIDNLLKDSPLIAPDGSRLSQLSDIEARIDETLEPLSQNFDGWKADVKTTFSQQLVKTSNVVGVIEGEGPHADETIVIGGHYDHLGYGAYGSRARGRVEIHNGADDNATGTVAIMELARRFGKADKKPARRLVFIAFSAEEKGLLGAAHYVAEPLFPLDKTVAMINFDMIGQLRNDALSLIGIASGGEVFDKLVDEANTGTPPLKLNKVPGGGGSDHLHFQRNNIPVIFFHTGTESGYYHTPEDDYETINVPGAVRVIDFSERVVKLIADAEEKPAFVASGGGRRRARPSFVGTRFDYTASEKGMTITEVTDESPAAKAGLQAGDIIVSVAGEKITERNGWTAFLTANGPGKEVEIKFLRGDEEKSVVLTLARTPRRAGRGRNDN